MFEEKRQSLVKNLERKGYLESKEVKNAFLQVPRELFIPENLQNQAYVDTPLQIGNGQTISAPHMIAIMCEALNLNEGQKVLEIGTGSGYHAAIVSKIIGKDGQVYSIERFSSLADNAKKNLKQAEIKNVTVQVGDGSKGLSKFEPYDRIYVTCAAPSVPSSLTDQLKDPGILLIPVGKTFCDLEKLEKKDGRIITKNLGGCAFVPLVGKHGH